MSALALVACGGQELATPQVEAPQDAHVAGMSPQGERLQASRLGGTWAVLPTGAVDAQGVAYDKIGVEKGELVAYRGSQEFRRADLIGAQLLAANPPGNAASIELHIQDAYPHGDPALPEWEYDIVWKPLGSANEPTPLCQEYATNNGALPFAGYWTPTGVHTAMGTGMFSFGCHGGVIMKCHDWGYKPYETWTKTNPATPLLYYHQTCTRLARADYCSQGDSYTMERTPIDYYDNLPIVEETQDAYGNPVFPFEAAWRMDSVTERPALLCLSKKRWDTIPLGGACPLTLPDPRLDKRNLFCDDLSWKEWMARGAILGNDSLFIDRGLFRWVNKITQEQMTSVKYIYRGVAGNPNGTPAGYSFVDFEGAAFAFDLSQKGYLPPGSLLPLYSFYSPSRGDRLTTTSPDPNTLPHLANDGYPLDYDASSRTLEGYIFKPPVFFPSPAPHPHAKLIFSWYSPSRHEHTTSLVKPNPAVNPDYKLVRTEGYVLYKK